MGLLRTILFGLVLFFIARFIMRAVTMVRRVDPRSRTSPPPDENKEVEAMFEEIDSKPLK